jgi:pyrimidine operon attenuation protein/uracil phosphoribosyltransferase
MKILNEKQIGQKIKRLAIEILENNYEEESLLLAGINNRGMAFAQLLVEQLQAITKVPIELTQIRLNPANPLADPVEIGMPIDSLQGRALIVVDDVANTGRTIFFAIKPLLQTLPRKVEVAVLVDRKHKSFPIKVDYVGLSLATTLLQNIDVHLPPSDTPAVFLK